MGLFKADNVGTAIAIYIGDAALVTFPIKAKLR
jgi:hypothetical protein